MAVNTGEVSSLLHEEKACTLTKSKKMYGQVDAENAAYKEHIVR